MNKNYKNTAEIIAQIVENADTPKKVANKWWKHVRETINAADLTNPDTIRLLYPIASQIAAENQKKRLHFRSK